MQEYQWTKHSLYKLKQYGLSQQRVKRVIRAPFRVEEGIVPRTIAVMVPAGNFKLPKVGEKPAWKQEIWAMYRIGAKSRKPRVPSVAVHNLPAPAKYRIISAWRYPGVSPKNNPVPDEILRELAGI